MKTKIGAFSAVASAVLYGIMPLFAKNIYVGGGNSITLCVCRYLFCIPFLLFLIKFFLKEPLRVNRNEFKKLFLAAQGSMGTTLLLFTSYNYISSGVATTIHFVYPSFVLIGCMVIYHEKINKIQALSCLFCMGGMFCFYKPDQQNSLLGMILAFASGISNAFYIIYYSKSGLSNMHMYKMMYYLSLINCVELFIISLITGKLSVHMTGRAWGMSIVFSMFFSLVAGLLFQLGIRMVGPQKASILSTFEPITSIVIGMAVFQEGISLKNGVGIVSILLATVFLTIYDKQSPL